MHSILPADYLPVLKKHKAGFAPGAFEAFLDAIIAADIKHSAIVDNDEDSLFEMILDDVLPAEADENLEGKVMMLLDDYFDLRNIMSEN